MGCRHWLRNTGKLILQNGTELIVQDFDKLQALVLKPAAAGTAPSAPAKVYGS
jgi:hypothetical protein